MIIDFATLTGACIIALGTAVSGLLGNDKKIINSLFESGERTGEKVWELPLTKDYKKLIQSDIADIKNLGGRGAGTITAAAFLSHFVADYPWAHLDIAGTAWTQDGTPKKSYIKRNCKVKFYKATNESQIPNFSLLSPVEPLLIYIFR